MEAKFIKGIREVCEKYDTFFIDLWGVIHNGVKLHSEAMNVLKKLDKLNKRLVLISNAPRPSKSVEKFLLKLNMDKNFTEKVFTSGEATLKAIEKKFLNKKFFHLGPERDNDLISMFEKNKTNLKKCNFILCTGLFDEHTSSLDYYKNLLKIYTNLKMICTNPDLVVMRGNKKEYCAGSVAEVFEKIGGEVDYFGKPHPAIYNYCIKNNEKILAIGDNIRTDIKGANNMKIDSLLITSGIHKDEFLNLPNKKYDLVLKKYKTKTNYYQDHLNW